MKFAYTILFSLILSLMILVSAVPAYAQPGTGGNVTPGSTSGPQTPGTGGNVTGGNTQSTFTLRNPLKGIDSVGGLLAKFIEILSYLFILLAVLMIIWTGLQMILARGNPEKLKEQGQRLGYILIGVALVIGARVIITVIINTLEATGTVDPRVIQSTNRALDGR
jgi:hypothetical protein